MGADQGHVTMLLGQAAQGDAQAAARLLPLVYDELRNLAKYHLSKAPAGNTLQPTALVHEAYLKLVGGGDPGWDGRRHFFGAAGNAMRNILVDQARRKSAVKHGGGRKREDIDQVDLPIAMPVEDVLSLDQALAELERADPRQAEIVTLRFFAGLTTEQTAEAMGVSVSTLDREWRFIRSFLHARLKGFDGSL
jgi:RNA polymerase sigma factor (TIGR02999 family)